MFARSLLLPAVLSGLAACAPYRPPPEPPPLVVARQPVRVVRADAAAPAVSVVVRAGSAYDPPSREGLAFVLAEAMAWRAGATVEVRPEVVIFRAAPGQAARLAEALAAPISPEALAAGVAAAQARLAATDCAAAAESVVPAWVFAGHPYGHAAAGRTSVLPTLTAGELEGFRLLRYVRGAAAVAVGGGAEVPGFDEAFAPALSAPVAPTVRSKLPRADVVVVAPVAAACTAVGVRWPASWSAAQEAVARVRAALSGAAAPPARTDAAWWGLGADRGGAAPEGAAFDAAKAAVHAALAAPSAEADAVDVLLAEVRGSTHPPRPEVLAAVDALTPDVYVSGVQALLGAAPVTVTLTPDAPPAAEATGPHTPESPVVPRVVTREELLR